MTKKEMNVQRALGIGPMYDVTIYCKIFNADRSGYFCIVKGAFTKAEAYRTALRYFKGIPERRALNFSHYTVELVHEVYGPVVEYGVQE